MFYRLSSKFFTLFSNYSSNREVIIPNTIIATIHRILQFIVLAYIFLYIVWTRKGYQLFEEPRGSSVIKIKGVARVKIGNSKIYNKEDVSQTLWDSGEYGIPPLEENAFFIATRKTISFDQTLGICSSALTEKSFCDKETLCKKDKVANNLFGFLTGKCVSSFENRSLNVCEINAWCPEELSNSTDDRINIDDLQTFTVFIKTIVSFSGFKIKLRTVKEDTNFSCRFHIKNDSRCPIFRIGYIIEKLKQEDSTINLTNLYSQGGLIEIQQDWQCNFDFDKQRKDCFPSYTFKMLQSGDDTLSPGINYRFVDKYRLNGKEYRTLTKIYGLRFILTITGKGGKFDLYYLFLSVGSGISCLIIADFICEFIFMYIHKNNEQFKENKLVYCNLIENENEENIQSTKF